MATLAVRRLKAPRLGYLDDFGIGAMESTIQGALAALTAANNILGVELEMGESRRATRLRVLRITPRFVIGGDVCQAHRSLSPDRVH